MSCNCEPEACCKAAEPESAACSKEVNEKGYSNAIFSRTVILCAFYDWNDPHIIFIPSEPETIEANPRRKRSVYGSLFQFRSRVLSSHLFLCRSDSNMMVILCRFVGKAGVATAAGDSSSVVLVTGMRPILLSSFLRIAGICWLVSSSVGQ